MKTTLNFTLRILILLSLLVGSYLWATELMDSVYAYRSPLHANPPQPGEPLLAAGAAPATQRVVFVLVDALRLDTAYDAAVMPFLNGLRQQGAWARMYSRPPSYSAPSYSVIFAGAWPDVSDGPALNVGYEDMPTWTQDNLFSAVHRAGMKTAVSAFNWFEKLIPQQAVSTSFYTAGEDQQADHQVVNAALPWLRDGNYQLIFIHLDQVDYAGHHEGGPKDLRWSQAASRADNLIAEIAAELDFEQDTLLVASDHGQIDRGGHGGHESIVRLEPFVLVGAGVKPGEYGDVEMVDIAPTLAVLLGANIPASSQGHVRTEMLNLPVETISALQPALQAQQSQLLHAYQTAIGSTVVAETGEDIVGLHQAAMDAARSRRLASERLPRAVLALLVAILPLTWFWWKRRLELPWYLGAGMLYLLMFNLRYAVLDQRTYSLSSVASADELILFCITTTALALLVSWLLAALLRKIFRLKPSEASLWTLDLALAVIYLLALPILWSYVLNGALVSWMLPDFPSMFMGFLSLIQVLAVSAFGLLLAGLTAITTKVIKFI